LGGGFGRGAGGSGVTLNLWVSDVTFICTLSLMRSSTIYLLLIVCAIGFVIASLWLAVSLLYPTIVSFE
jgi:hypothetical protein